MITQTTKGLAECQGAASNGSGPSRLQSARLVAAGAELGRSAKPVRNTLGMISNLLINTPLQRGGSGGSGFLNRFSGFSRDAETAEAVVECCGPAITLLKRGVNSNAHSGGARLGRSPAAALGNKKLSGFCERAAAGRGRHSRAPGQNENCRGVNESDGFWTVKLASIPAS